MIQFGISREFGLALGSLVVPGVKKVRKLNNVGNRVVNTIHVCSIKVCLYISRKYLYPCLKHD